MTPITIIDYRSPNERDLVWNYLSKLSFTGDVVSDRSRELTIKVFGEPLTPREIVHRICNEVKTNGIESLLHYGLVLDGFDCSDGNLRVPLEEMEQAHSSIDPGFLDTIKRIRANIHSFQTAILPDEISIDEQHRQLQLLYRPIRSAGLCIPGGAAAYPSTILMTAVPAQAAGVQRIAAISPPTQNGSKNPYVLATCFELGITEVYRIGGAQGVAALAYGVDGIDAVDKIVGPGNLFVTLAKQFVSDTVGIDMLAGPTEVVVIADESADPKLVAADLISQAEHSPGSAILITWTDKLFSEVQGEIDRQLKQSSRSDLIRTCLADYGIFIHVDDDKQAADLSNHIAPEHLQICTKQPREMLQTITSAGAIFLGHDTPVALGDYVAGPSHTLPTGTTARFSNGLSSIDFLKRMSVIEYDRTALKDAAGDLRTIAEVEGLTAHADSVDIRLTDR